MRRSRLMFRVACKDGISFDLPITMVFQPIVDVHAKTVVARL